MQISAEDTPHPDDVAYVQQALGAFNLRHMGDPGRRALTLFLRDEQERVVGGLIGEIVWRWLHIGVLWVDEDRRGRGYGGGLMRVAETEGRHHGATHMFLDTFDFQALPFYQKQGFQIYGKLDGFPAGHTQYYLRKAIA